MPPLTSVQRTLEENGWARFSLVFLLIVVLKWDTLLLPPVWDTAMGLFPAALTLAQNGFDLIELLGMPGYAEGGPNVHGTSPVTLVTALVLWISGGGTRGFLILHLLHFAVAAVAILGLCRLARPVFGHVTSLLLGVCVLLHPVFSTQVGFLYLEVPLFLATVMALLAWVEGRFWPAVLWATTAYMTKETGVIVPATLVLGTLLERREVREKAERVGKILLLPAVWTGVVVLMGRYAARQAEDFALLPSLDAVFGGIGQYLARFLLNVPDLLVFLVVFVVTALASAAPVWAALRSGASAVSSDGHANPSGPAGAIDAPRESQEFLVLGYSGMLIVLFVLLFMVALPITAGFTVVLPRYYVMILPFLLLWAGYGMKRLLSAHFTSPAAFGFAILAGLFALNAGGALYPLDVDTEGPGNDPALTERSNAYRRLQTLEFAAIRALEALPPGVPVYYGHYEHYLLSYPGLGYSRGPLSNGHNFSVESLAELIRAEPMPPCVYTLFNYPWLGGEKILGLIRFAEMTPGLSAEVVQEFRDGRYVIILVRIRSGDADCPV